MASVFFFFCLAFFLSFPTCKFNASFARHRIELLWGGVCKWVLRAMGIWECFLSLITAFCIGGGTKRCSREKTKWTSPKFMLKTTVANVQLKFCIHVSFEFGSSLQTFTLNLRKQNKQTNKKTMKGSDSQLNLAQKKGQHKEEKWQLLSVLTCPWSYRMVNCLFEYKEQKRPDEYPRNRTLLALICPAKKHYVFIRRSLELLTPTISMSLFLNTV